MSPLTGFGLSVLIETPILLIGLSDKHGWPRRLFAGVWLTACSYPIVVLTLPFVFPPDRSKMAYLLTAETFAPLSECLLFWFAFDRLARYGRGVVLRDCIAIVVANLASFGMGEFLQ